MRVIGLAAVVAVTQSACFLLDVKHVVDDVTYSSGEGNPLTVEGYAVSPPHAGGSFRAGVGAADITPPPGFPTGGHGPAGDVARGYWIRLKARAFFFEDATGRTLALVSSELFAIPGGLRAEVAARVVKALRGRKLDVAFSVDSLVLAATHTHHGPGNFMTARSHNQFGSTYPGFSEELFRFLAGRIADAVVAAIVDARSNAGRVELMVHTHAVDESMLLNRAPSAFVLNRDRDESLAQLDTGLGPMPHCPAGHATPPGGWDLYGCPRLRAVDRALTVLEIARGGKRAGGLVFFAAHPSDLPADTPFYSPDFAGAALARLEREHGGIFGFFNGAEGDVTLQRDARNLVEVERFGASFAKAVEAALQAPARTISNPSVVVKTAAFRPSLEGGASLHERRSDRGACSRARHRHGRTRGRGGQSHAAALPAGMARRSARQGHPRAGSEAAGAGLAHRARALADQAPLQAGGVSRLDSPGGGATRRFLARGGPRRADHGGGPVRAALAEAEARRPGARRARQRVSFVRDHPRRILGAGLRGRLDHLGT